MAIDSKIISGEIPDTSNLDRFGVLFGYPISHSLSPPMHQAIYDHLGLNWRQFYLQSTDIPQFLALREDPKFYGAAVTMPHKVAILNHLDELTEEGRDVGACNTIFLREENGRRIYVGTNTDVIGIREAFYQNISTPDSVFHGRPGLVVGGGGAARSAVYALKKWMQCQTVYLVNRDVAEVEAVMSWCKSHGYGDGLVHVATAEQAESLEGPGAIVACVPDFPPVTPAEVEARKVLETFLAKPHKGAILEMCYHPKPYTQIAGLSEKAGWKLILGTEAMIYQGFAQDIHWTGRSLDEMPKEAVNALVAKAVAEHR